MSDPLYLWLEPGRSDLDEGLRARVADPLWFLARQWQLGEHRGEDASSPVAIDVTAQHQPVSYDRRRPDLDPTVVPAEALLEAEPGDWWTLGRRIRLGRAAAPLLAPEVVSRYAFGVLPAPYDALGAEIDGRAVFTSGLLAGNPIFAQVPAPLTDRWSASELDYTASFAAGTTRLIVPHHDGGDVDWFSVDGEPGVSTLRPDTAESLRRLVVPTRLDYPGAPNPRWWQLEDRATDIGGFAPDRSHLATMLLIDVAVSHSDDWFSFHVPPPFDADHRPSSGVLVRLSDVAVRDSFDQVWPLSAPPATGPGAWSLFHNAGLAESELLIWPVAVAPNSGPLLDDVLIGVDEDANLAWAVELSADGLRLLPDAATDTAVAETTRTGTRNFRYFSSTTLPDHWHPYQRVRAGEAAYDPQLIVGAGDGRSGYWRQAVLADLSDVLPRPRPGPVSRMIGGPSGPGLGRGHELAPDAIPSNGVRLQRRAMLARDTAGRPVLWVERSARPVTGPPTSHLRFDVLAEDH
jgi:hypothetical protein